MSFNLVSSVPPDVGGTSPHKPVSSLASGSYGSGFGNIVSGLASAVSPYLGVGLNLIGNLMNNQSNRDLVEQQQNFALKLWKLNNEYNKPINQIKRLREASINPMLAMGNLGTGNSNSPAEVAKPIPNQMPVDFTQASALNLQKESNEIAKQNADTQRMAVESDMPVKKAQALNFQQQTRNLHEELYNIMQTRKNLEADFQYRQLDIDKHKTENLYYDLYEDDIMTSQVALNMAEAHIKSEEVKYIQRRVNNETLQAQAAMLNAKSSRDFMKKQGELIQLRIDNFQTELDKLVADKKLSQNQAALLFKEYCNVEWKLGNEYMRTIIQGVATGVDTYNSVKKKGNKQSVTPFEYPYQTDDYGFTKTW